MIWGVRLSWHPSSWLWADLVLSTDALSRFPCVNIVHIISHSGVSLPYSSSSSGCPWASLHQLLQRLAGYVCLLEMNMFGIDTDHHVCL